MKKSDGFTLVELLVGILCASIVTAAAMTLMLMGARTNRALLDANSEQQTVRIITALVDKLTSEGDIHEITFQENNDGTAYIGWELLDSTGKSILSYSGGSIRSRDGAELMKGIVESSLNLSKSPLNGSLLSISIKTENDTYTTSAYSRSSKIISDIVVDKLHTSANVTVGTTWNPNARPESDPIAPDANDIGNRFTFLKALCTQYGSTGTILDHTLNPELYYSLWYLREKTNITNLTYDTYNLGLDPSENHWSETTAWCACYLSWGLYHVLDCLDLDANGPTPYFASVASGYRGFNGTATDKDKLPDLGDWKDNGAYIPIPGDFIFFDWQNTRTDSYTIDPNDLDHVGVVFYVDSQYVYTIEGNTNIKTINGKDVGEVALQRYLLTDPRIVGYGILDWKQS